MEDFVLVVTRAVEEKLSIKHQLTVLEVEEAFFNWEGIPLRDDREKHKTKPPTIWFCSYTTEGRILKIAGIPFKERREFVLKSAFDAEPWEIELYEENQR